jgi:hypothetical protein
VPIVQARDEADPIIARLAVTQVCQLLSSALEYCQPPPTPDNCIPLLPTTTDTSKADRVFGVLSNDSDFYIYPVKYIPFEQLKIDSNGHAVATYYHYYQTTQALQIAPEALPIVRHTYPHHHIFLSACLLMCSISLVVCAVVQQAACLMGNDQTKSFRAEIDRLIATPRKSIKAAPFGIIKHILSTIRQKYRASGNSVEVFLQSFKSYHSHRMSRIPYNDIST